jgi:phosphoribosyl 1,2-cyclic phosphodiesterase
LRQRRGEEKPVIVRFWGTRGSLPVALTAAGLKDKLVTALVAAAGRNLDTPEKARAFVDHDLDFSVGHSFGGNSSCVELETGGSEYVLCDLGSGVRPFGNSVLAKHGFGKPNVFHVLMSHVHWDHIMGFPFFVPAYIPGNLIRIYGCHFCLEEGFRRQQSAPCFPVEFDTLGATIEFVHLDPGKTHDIAGLRVTPKLQLHTTDSYGYRVEMGGKTLVYSTDSEHKLDDVEETRAFADFFRDADLVIFDAMYSLADAISVKEDWGHSSNVVGVELCQLAHAKTLCLFHHEPASDDEQLARVLAETRRFEEITRGDHRVEVIAAYDGLEITL